MDIEQVFATLYAEIVANNDPECFVGNYIFFAELSELFRIGNRRKLTKQEMEEFVSNNMPDFSREIVGNFVRKFFDLKKSGGTKREESNEED